LLLLEKCVSIKDVVFTGGTKLFGF
jgi:hypothetical protein